jgi:hypothetical protein
VALLPIVISAVLAWFDKRGLAAKQHSALELAKSRVDFIDRWVKVQQEVNSAERFEQIKRETAFELDELKKGLSETLAETEEKPEAVPVQESAKTVFQRLILWYRPLSFSGWIAHIVFYIVLFLTLSSVISYQPGIDLTTNQFSWSTLWSDLIVVFIFFIPTLIVRAIAIRIDRKTQERLHTVSPVIEALS